MLTTNYQPYYLLKFYYFNIIKLVKTYQYVHLIT